MCNLISDVNNKPKINAQVWKTQSEIYIGNTIEYDVKSYQFKRTILKCTEVQLKVLQFKHSQKNMMEYPTSMWHNKKIWI